MPWAAIPDDSTSAAASQLEADQATARFGENVASAGDVNGDGYADVIVGCQACRQVDINGGAAFVFLGSPSGVADANPTTADALLEADQDPSAQFGWSVAAAGDVDGDAFADVIAGAPCYDTSTSNEGAAFVFHGNAGREGRPVLARQRRGDGSGTPVQPCGRTRAAPRSGAPTAGLTFGSSSLMRATPPCKHAPSGVAGGAPRVGAPTGDAGFAPTGGVRAAGRRPADAAFKLRSGSTTGLWASCQVPPPSDALRVTEAL